MSYLNLIKELKKTTGTNDKIKIIENNQDGYMVKEIFEFVYDNEFSSGLAINKLSKEINTNDYDEIDSLSELLSYLRTNNTGTNKVIATVQNAIIRGYDSEDAEILKEILAQDLKIGISEKGINKAIPGLLEDFDVMKGFKIEDLSDKEIDSMENDDFYATLKLDGNRVIVYNYTDGRRNIVSATGKKLNGYEEILEGLELPFSNCIYDGEMLADVEGNSLEQYDATTKIMRTKGKKENIKFNIFDYCFLDEFRNGQGTIPYYERRKNLNYIPSTKFQKVVPVIGVYKITDEELMSTAKKLMNEGHEGVMLNNANEVYKRTRNRGILKIKKFFECDVLCTGVVEGKGNIKGNLGAITVSFKGKECTVGSGFKSKWKKTGSTYEETNIGSSIRREDIWENPELIIGKIVTIRYMEETKDGMMRMPRIKDIRDDKNEPSYN